MGDYIRNKISAVICVKDRSKSRIKRCINSFKKSSLINEIIVVDYGSAKPVKLKGNKIKLIRTENKLWNKSHALNLGIKQAKSEYIMTVDCDMILHPLTLTKLKPFLERNNFIYDSNVLRIKITDLNKDFNQMVKKSTKWFDSTRNWVYNRAFGGIQVFSKEFINNVNGYYEEVGYGWGYIDNILYEQARIMKFNTINLGLPIIHQEHKNKKEDNLPSELKRTFELMRYEKTHFMDKRYAEGQVVNPTKWGNKYPNSPYFDKWIKNTYDKLNESEVKRIQRVEKMKKAIKQGKKEIKIDGQIFKIFR